MEGYPEVPLDRESEQKTRQMLFKVNYAVAHHSLFIIASAIYSRETHWQTLTDWLGDASSPTAVLPSAIIQTTIHLFSGVAKQEG